MENEIKFLITIPLCHILRNYTLVLFIIMTKQENLNVSEKRRDICLCFTKIDTDVKSLVSQIQSPGSH